MILKDEFLKSKINDSIQSMEEANVRGDHKQAKELENYISSLYKEIANHLDYAVKTVVVQALYSEISRFLEGCTILEYRFKHTETFVEVKPSKVFNRFIEEDKELGGLVGGIEVSIPYQTMLVYRDNQLFLVWDNPYLDMYTVAEYYPNQEKAKEIQEKIDTLQQGIQIHNLNDWITDMLI